MKCLSQSENGLRLSNENPPKASFKCPCWNWYTLEHKLQTHIKFEVMIHDLTWPQPTLNDLSYLSSVFYDTHHIFLMLPFVPGGDLFTLIHSKNDFKKEDIKGYAYQIIKIFTFLHRNGSSVFAVVSATTRLVTNR